MSSPSPAPWRSAIHAARTHLVPGLVIQATALALVLAYYHYPPVNALLARLLALRKATGFTFSVVSTAIFGGVLPFLYLRSQRSPGAKPPYDWGQGARLLVYWGYKGIEVDVFYRILARVIGPGHDAGTIVSKAMIDQFGYCPFFAVPTMVFFYAWIESHYDWPGVWADFRTPRWYARRVLPVLISNVAVWAPTVAIIYALPTPLQLPLENLVLCFFTLIVAHQTKADARTEPSTHSHSPSSTRNGTGGGLLGRRAAQVLGDVGDHGRKP